MSASNYLENELLDHVLNNATAAFDPADTLYLALFTAPDSAGGTLEDLEAGTLTNEVSGNGYSRQAITFGTSTNGTAQGPTGSAVTFTASGGSFGTVTSISIMDSASGGNPYFSGNLSTAKQVDDGDSLQFAVNSISITMS